MNFAGSSYLGLSSDPAVLAAGSEALRESGAGYQLARTYGLATPAHLLAEAEAMSFFEAAAAVFLATGYAAALAMVAALKRPATRVFIDEFAHHSLRDGVAITGLEAHAYQHLDCEHLDALLRRHMRAGERALVLTDGVYSTRGKIAPLADLAHLASAYGGELVVDESHGFGVLGADGRGAYEHCGLDLEHTHVCGSTSKGLGVVGGVIPASAPLARAVRVTAPARGGSAGLPAAAAMLAASLRSLRSTPELRTRLRRNVTRAKTGLRALGLEVGNTEVPICAFDPPGLSAAALQAELERDGLLVLASDYIGAPTGGLIRCAVFADHSDDDWEQLMDALKRRL